MYNKNNIKLNYTYTEISPKVQADSLGVTCPFLIYILCICTEQCTAVYCKFKTFGFLETLKVQIQSKYLASTALSLLQT